MDDTMLNSRDVAKLLQLSQQQARRIMDRLGSERVTDTSPRRLKRKTLEDYVTKRNLSIDWSVLDEPARATN